MKKKKKKGSGGPKMAPYRPEEEAFLRRWRGVKSAPSLFEKIDRDAAFEGALNGRVTKDEHGKPIGEPGMGTQWGIGKPKAPN